MDAIVTFVREHVFLCLVAANYVCFGCGYIYHAAATRSATRPALALLSKLEEMERETALVGRLRYAAGEFDGPTTRSDTGDTLRQLAAEIHAALYPDGVQVHTPRRTEEAARG